jgi:outer membrane receptor protein involved in Fe transport
MLTGNYDRNTDILAGDRSFTASNNPYLTLYPDMKSYAFVGSAHQEVTSDLRLGLDALYSHRNASRGAPYTATNPVEVSGLVASTSSWNYSIAPSAMLRLSNWDFSLSGVYGRSHLTSLSRRYPGSPSSVDLENETLATEFAGEGRLFALPAGDIRMALGGGYRRDEFMSGPMTKPIRGSQDNIFGYAELSIPLTSPKQAMAGFYRMALTTALRYEDYPGMGRLATPKFGAIWSPTADIDFKLSWGRSFKAPTLYQRLNPTVVYLFPGNLYGERQGAPAGQTILGLYGGKSDLKPEKADSLSATAALHPKFAPGLELAATYFRVNYRDRVVAPVSSLNRVLIDPVFADLVTFSPSAALIASTIATAPAGLDDQSGYGKPFDPTSVFAIIDGRSQNVARDKVNGMDVSLRYRFDAGDAGVFTLDGSGTYIKSSRILIAGTPTFDLAGTIFNPPHFKFRGGVGWSREKLLINAVVNFIGGVSDNRRVELADVDGMTSFDLAIKYRLGSAAHGLDVQVSALNLLDAKPDVIRGTGANTSFDSTNYSAIGRYLSLSLTKNF